MNSYPRRLDATEDNLDRFCDNSRGDFVTFLLQHGNVFLIDDQNLFQTIANLNVGTTVCRAVLEDGIVKDVRDVTELYLPLSSARVGEIKAKQSLLITDENQVIFVVKSDPILV